MCIKLLLLGRSNSGSSLQWPKAAAGALESASPLVDLQQVARGDLPLVDAPREEKHREFMA